MDRTHEGLLYSNSDKNKPNWSAKLHKKDISYFSNG